MKMIQLLPTLAYGDAIGNEALALDDLFHRNHIHSEIYAVNIDKKVANRAKHFHNKMKTEKDDILIYHMAITSGLKNWIEEEPCHKVVRYHNITPPEFFCGYSSKMVNILEQGSAEFQSMSRDFEYGLADSAFNREGLLNYGYQCPIDVVPILLALDDYKKRPDSHMMARLKKRKGKIILHVGRIAPNKKIEDVIQAFSLYQKYYDPDAVLALAGKYDEQDPYYRRLKKYLERLSCESVFFMGHTSFAEILAFYHSADLYLCMSEHEGFCVPLVESMVFSLPVLAFRSTAIPETLGDAGILLDQKDPLLAAGLINRMVTDTALREILKEKEQQQLEKYLPEKVADLFMSSLSRFF